MRKQVSRFALFCRKISTLAVALAVTFSLTFNLLHFSQHSLRSAPSLTYCIFNAEGGEYLVNVVVLQMCFFLDFLFGTVCVLLLALFGRHFIERLIWFSLENRPLHLVSRFVYTFFT